jgi:uncharacterized membrane protein
VTKPASSGKEILKTLTGLLLIVFIIGVVVSPILLYAGMAPGADTGSYLFTTKFLVNYYLTHKALPHINPYWYCGFELLHNTPLLVYLPLSLLYLIQRDILPVSRLFDWLLLISVGLAMFVALRPRCGWPGAIFGSVLLALTPLVVYQVLCLGTFARILALVFYPIAFWAFSNIIKQERTYLNLVLLVIFLSLSVLAHPTGGAAFLIFLTVYLIVWSLVNKQLSFRTVWVWMLALLLTLGLVAYYLLPFFVERLGWTVVPVEVFKSASFRYAELYSWLGPVLLIFAILSLFGKSKDPDKTALFLTSVLFAVLSLGTYLPFFDLLPIKSIYPYNFLFAAIFGFSYLAGLSADVLEDRLRSKSLVVIVLCLAILFVGYGGYRYAVDGVSIGSSYFSKDNIKLASRLRSLTNPGRVMPMKYPFAYLNWWIMNEAKKPMVEGWYFALTQTGRNIALIYDAIDYGYPDYAVQKLDRMNTRYLVTNQNFNGEAYSRFLALMKKARFTKVAQTGGNTLYFKGEKSRYIQPVRSDVLVIGKHGSIVASVIDSAVTGGSSNLNDYRLSFLKYFDVLVLAGIDYSNKKEAEALVKDYLKSGGTVVIDMVGQQKSLIEETPSLFGVSGYPEATTKKMHLKLAPSLAAETKFDSLVLEIPSEKVDDRRVKMTEWRHVMYLGLDRSMATIEEKTQALGAIGYKELAEGRPILVGVNLFYHAFLTHDPKELKLVNALVRSEKKPIEPMIKIEQGLMEPEHIKFEYQAEKGLPLLVSFAYSPHWKAWLDGRPINIFSIEDLMAISLPEGKHRVEFKYSNTPIHYVGNSISFLAIVVLVVLVWRDRKGAREAMV